MDDKLDRVLESLQQVAVNVESLRVSLNRLIVVTEDHEDRLRRLETWRSNLTPVIAVCTFILGSLFNAFLHQLQ